MKIAKAKRARHGKVIVLDPFHLAAGESNRRPIARRAQRRSAKQVQDDTAALALALVREKTPPPRYPSDNGYTVIEDDPPPPPPHRGRSSQIVADLRTLEISHSLATERRAVYTAIRRSAAYLQRKGDLRFTARWQDGRGHVWRVPLDWPRRQ